MAVPEQLPTLSVAVFRRLLDLLRREFPTKWPVEVRRRDSVHRHNDGYHRCLPRKRVGPRGGVTYPYSHIIVVRRDLYGERQAEITLHEWAHALRREEDGGANHDDGFWKIYGRMYRKLFDEGAR